MFNWVKYCGACLVLGQLSGCYVLKQGIYQNNLINSQVPIDGVIRAGRKPDFVLNGLRLIDEVRGFAASEKLQVGDSYKQYIDIDKKAVAFTVQAAYADKFAFKKWWFPIIGKVPYLGFFSSNERNIYARELEKKGFDVSRSQVAAFSSLGWFDDPIYKPMLNRKPVFLVRLLLHELIHRTFWSDRGGKFNENLAEYLSNRLTNKFYRERKDQAEIRVLNDYLKDRVLFKKWVMAMRDELNVYYRSINSESRSFAFGKRQIVKNYQSKKWPKFLGKSFQYARKKNWNNASIMGVSLYLPETEEFDSAVKCFGREKSTGEFLMSLKNSEDSIGTSISLQEIFCSNKKSI